MADACAHQRAKTFQMMDAAYKAGRLGARQRGKGVYRAGNRCSVIGACLSRELLDTLEANRHLGLPYGRLMSRYREDFPELVALGLTEIEGLRLQLFHDRAYWGSNPALQTLLGEALADLAAGKAVDARYVDELGYETRLQLTP